MSLFIPNWPTIDFAGRVWLIKQTKNKTGRRNPLASLALLFSYLFVVFVSIDSFQTICSIRNANVCPIYIYYASLSFFKIDVLRQRTRGRHSGVSSSSASLRSCPSEYSRSDREIRSITSDCKWQKLSVDGRSLSRIVGWFRFSSDHLSSHSKWVSRGSDRGRRESQRVAQTREGRQFETSRRLCQTREQRGKREDDHRLDRLWQRTCGSTLLDIGSDW